MKIVIQESARKDFRKIDKKNALKILQNLSNLEVYPKVSNIKKLKNFYPPLRYRIGEYRVLFDIQDGEVIVVNIKHRKEAY